MKKKILDIDEYRERKGQNGRRDTQPRETEELDVDAIEIEDPTDFFDAQEKEQYMHLQLEKRQMEEELANQRKRLREIEHERREARYAARPAQDPQEREDDAGEDDGEDAFYSRKAKPVGRKKSERRRGDDAGESRENEEAWEEEEDWEEDREEEEDWEEDQEEENWEEEEERREEARGRRKQRGRESDLTQEDRTERWIRIASAITGVLILIVLAFIIWMRFIGPVIESEEEEGDVTIENNAGLTVYTTQGLNLRSSPNADGNDNIVTSVPAGTALTRIREEGSWSVVEYEGQTLYCATRYLQLGEN